MNMKWLIITLLQIATNIVVLIKGGPSIALLVAVSQLIVGHLLIQVTVESIVNELQKENK